MDTSHVRLTPMEQRVVAALLNGESVKEAARDLGTRVSTVRTHVKHVHQKSATHSLTAMILWAVDHRPCCVLPSEGIRAAS